MIGILTMGILIFTNCSYCVEFSRGVLVASQ